MEGKSLSWKKKEVLKEKDGQIAASDSNTSKVNPGDDSDKTQPETKILLVKLITSDLWALLPRCLCYSALSETLQRKLNIVFFFFTLTDTQINSLMSVKKALSINFTNDMIENNFHLCKQVLSLDQAKPLNSLIFFYFLKYLCD